MKNSKSNMVGSTGRLRRCPEARGFSDRQLSRQDLCSGKQSLAPAQGEVKPKLAAISLSLSGS